MKQNQTKRTKIMTSKQMCSLLYNICSEFEIYHVHVDKPLKDIQKRGCSSNAVFILYSAVN